MKENTENFNNFNKCVFDANKHFNDADANCINIQTCFDDLFAKMNDGLALHEMPFEKDGLLYSGNVLDVNKAFESIMNLKKQEVVGKNLIDIFQSCNVQNIESFITSMEAQKPASMDMFCPRIDKYLRASLYFPCKDRFAVLFCDVTKEKQLEEELRQANDSYKETLKIKKEELTKTQTILSNAFEQSPIGILLYDTVKSRVIAVNPECARLINKTTDELLKMTPETFNVGTECYNSDSQSMTFEEMPFFKTLKNNETIINQEVKIVYPDGDEKWILVSTAPIKYDNVDNHVISIIINDITNHKVVESSVQKVKYQLESQHKQLLLKEEQLISQNEELIAQNEELAALNIELEESQRVMTEAQDKFQTIAESAQDAIIMLDTNGLVAYWNPAATRIFGYTQEEMLGNDAHLILVPDEDRKLYQKGFPLFKMTGQGNVIGKTLELHSHKKDGNEIIIELSVSGIKHKGEWQAIGVARDITERKHTELKIKEYQEQLQAIYDGIIDGLFVIDFETKNFVNVNKSFCKMFGYSKEELLNMGLKDLHNHKDLYKMDLYFDHNNKEAQVFIPDVPCKRRDGTLFYADSGGGEIIYNNRPSIIAFFRDITERRNLEQTKENFIATLSHDLRVPLLAENHALKYLIKGSYGELTEKQTVAAQNMLNSNVDMLNLVNVLLDVYKYESGALELHKEYTNLQSLVKECISELSPLAENYKKTLKTQLIGEIPDINIDKKQIKRVLINLVSNAIYYTPEECVINIKLEFDNNLVITRIIDNGRGIPEDECDKIFDRYYTSSKKFRKVGTGLGLYLSKQIVVAHGGKIGVDSKLNEGSTFYFKLPL